MPRRRIPSTGVARNQRLTVSLSVCRLLALKAKILQQRKQLEELDKNMYVAHDERTEGVVSGAEFNFTNV